MSELRTTYFGTMGIAALGLLYEAMVLGATAVGSMLAALIALAALVITSLTLVCDTGPYTHVCR